VPGGKSIYWRDEYVILCGGYKRVKKKLKTRIKEGVNMTDIKNLKKISLKNHPEVTESYV